MLRGMTAIDHLKDQLASLAGDGDYTVYRLIDLAKELLDTARDDLTSDEMDELDDWLSRQFDANRGAARIRWGLLHGVFDSVQASLN
jgi:hypothetical protein